MRSHSALLIRGPWKYLLISLLSSSLEKPQATQSGLWKLDSPRDLKHAGVNGQSSALGALLFPRVSLMSEYWAPL